jgi:exonuclease SbcD
VRILHTSDWHLGRSFHGVDLLQAQAAHLDHLVETARTEQVDLVVVSGDVHDRALPPVGAVDLASDVLARLAGQGVRVVVTSGNHDSAIRLGSNARLVDAAGVHLRTRWQDVGTPVVVEDRWGPVAVHGLPYLEPDAVRQAWGLEQRTHAAALGAAMERVHADLDRRGGRSVVMAHAFVAGPAAQADATDRHDGPDERAAIDAMRSDSERELAVGGLAIAPTSLFTRPSYVALGHLHGARELTPTVRYSGSPLAYSFSEESHTKGSWLVELGPDGVERVDLVPAPVPRGLRRLRGRLDDLLTDVSLADAEDQFLAVTLTDPARPAAPLERLRSRFPHTLTLEFAPEGAVTPRAPVAPHVTGRSDLDVALGFVQDVRDLEPSTEEELLLRLACDCSLRAEDPDADPAEAGVA